MVAWLSSSPLPQPHLTLRHRYSSSSFYSLPSERYGTFFRGEKSPASLCSSVYSQGPTYVGRGGEKKKREKEEDSYLSPFLPQLFLNFSASKEALPPYQSHRKHALRRIPFFPFFDPLLPPPPKKVGRFVFVRFLPPPQPGFSISLPASPSLIAVVKIG